MVKADNVNNNLIALISAALFGMELWTGTDPFFAFLMAMCVLFFFLSFNRLGGLTTPVGGAFTVLGASTVLISQVAKIVLSQPADSYLKAPLPTALVMTFGMASVYVATHVRDILPSITPAVRVITNPSQYRAISLLTISTLVLFSIADAVIPTFRLMPGVLGFVALMPYLSGLALCTEVAYAIKTSGGRKSTTFLFYPIVLYIWIPAFYGLWKSGMFFPVMIYLVTIFSFRYRFRPANYAAGVAVLGLLFLIGLPLSKLGHNYIADKYEGDMIGSLTEFAEDLGESGGIMTLLDSRVDDWLAPSDDNAFGQYYGSDMGFLDRQSLIAAADWLIADSLPRQTEGLERFFGRVTLLPKALTGDAVTDGSNNYLAVRAGILDENDLVTGIAFGIFADLFAHFNFLGLLLSAPLLFLAFFLATDLVARTMTNNLWGIMMFAVSEHTLAESNGAGVIFHIVRTVPFFIAVFYVMETTSGLLVDFFQDRRSSHASLTLLPVVARGEFEGIRRSARDR